MIQPPVRRAAVGSVRGPAASSSPRGGEPRRCRQDGERQVEVGRPVDVGDVGQPSFGLHVDRDHRQITVEDDDPRTGTDDGPWAWRPSARCSAAALWPGRAPVAEAAPGPLRRSRATRTHGADTTHPSSCRQRRAPRAPRPPGRAGRAPRGNVRCCSVPHRWPRRATPARLEEAASRANLFTSSRANSFSRNCAVTPANGSSASAEVNSSVAGSTLAKNAASTDKAERQHLDGLGAKRLLPRGLDGRAVPSRQQHGPGPVSSPRIWPSSPRYAQVSQDRMGAEVTTDRRCPADEGSRGRRAVPTAPRSGRPAP